MNEYRVGNHQPQNLYRGDSFIGVMFDPADTAMIVKAMNQEKFEAPPASTLTYHVGSPDPRCLYRGTTLLGVLFSVEDAVLVARSLNEVAR